MLNSLYLKCNQKTESEWVMIMNMKKSWLRLIVNRSVPISFLQNLRRLALEALEELNFNLFSQSTLIKVLNYLALHRSAEKSNLRQVITRLFPWNPLEHEIPENIDLVIFTHEKDLDILPFSLIAALRSIQNPLSAVRIVAPMKCASTVENVIKNCQKEVSFVSDEELLNDLPDLDFSGRNKIAKMEIIKILAALNSSTRFTLLVDGDTLLLRQRNWVSKNGISVIVAQEYLRRHTRFNFKKLNLTKNKGLGFVTHHQIVDRDILLKFTTEYGGIQRLTKEFLYSFDHSENYTDIFPSEWQLFADLNLSLSARKVYLCKFSNLGVSRDSIKWRFRATSSLEEIEKIILEIIKTTPKMGSLSLHSYK